MAMFKGHSAAGSFINLSPSREGLAWTASDADLTIGRA